MKLVLLPGMDGSGQLFGPLRDALGTEVRTQVLRYPTQPPMDYTALTALVAQALPSDEPYVLLGESFAGPIALRLAAAAPPQLKGLVLCCTFATNPRPFWRGLRPLVPAWPAGAATHALLARLLMGRWYTPALARRFTHAVQGLPPAVPQVRLQAVMAVDDRQALREVRVPMLYLQARQDLVVPPSALGAVLAVRPEVEVARLDGPHFLLKVAPEACAPLLCDFMARVRGAADQRQDRGGPAPSA